MARGHVANAIFLEKLIKGGMAHKGFSVIEIMSNCHTQYGRRNKHPDPAELVEHIASSAVTLRNWEKMEDEEKIGKFPIGVLHKDDTRPEYSENYYKLQAHAQERVRDAARKIAEAEALKPKREPQGGASPLRSEIRFAGVGGQGNIRGRMGRACGAQHGIERAPESDVHSSGPRRPDQCGRVD